MNKKAEYQPVGPLRIRFAVLVFSAVACLSPCTLIGQRITVGPTVTISADAAADPHGESFLAVNPKNSKNLVAASNVARKSGAGTSAYVSHDAGLTWTRAVLPATAMHVSEGWDVISYFDGQGNAYYGSVYYGPYHKVNYGAGLWMTHSSDEGRTWSAATLLPGAKNLDRPFMGFMSTGRFAGRVYAGGVVGAIDLEGQRHEALAVAFSEDSATTFGPPYLVTGEPGNEISNLTNIIVTPDGTLILPFLTATHSMFAMPPRPVRELSLRAAASTDGGITFAIPPGTIQFKHSADRSNSVSSTVIDVSTGPFRGRLYFVYEDNSGSGTDIRVTHSSDNGKTWSTPVTVNDNSTPAIHVNPAIAVDNRGVVGVVWNDRRAHNDKCYDLYFSASLDGGETFRPNVTPGGKPTCAASSQGHFPDGGETQGLVGVDGIFHTAWIDGSSGVTQLATTPFTVQGAARAP